MAEWSGKTKGGLTGYKAFGLLIRLTNIHFVYFVLRFVAFYYLLFSDKKAIKFYFEKIHGYSRIKSFKSIFENYFLLGQVLIDKMAFLSGANDKYTFCHEGIEHLEEMVNQNKGGILLGAHLGNWEVAGKLLERINTKVHVVLLDAEHEKIKKYVQKIQGTQSIQFIPIKEDQSHLLRIQEVLKRNEFVAMHGDRFLSGMNYCTVSFLGENAKFPTGPLYMASKFKVPVSFVYTLKDSPTEYHFYATKGRQFEYPGRLKSRKSDIKAMVEIYVQELEKKVQKYPTQWFNFYHFWETREL